MADDSVKIDIKLEDAKAKAEASKAGKDISKNLESGLKGASNAAKNSEAQIKSAMSGAASSAKSSFSDVGSSAKSNFSGVSDAAKTASSDSSSSFQNIASDSKGSFQDVGDAAKDGFEGVSDAADQVADDVDDTFSGVFPSATGIAIAAATALATAVAAIATQAVQVGMEFDKSMSQVAATMGVTTDQIGELRDFALEMGAQTAFTSTEAANALNYMALAGYNAETSMEMLPSVLNLAAAGNMDLATASDMVTDSQTALGLSLDETKTMIDQMAKTSSMANADVRQLGEATLTVGGTAKNLAGGTKELNQVLGVLADNSIKGSEGGTALRNIILSLSAPTDTARKKIDELGVSVFDAEGKMRPLPEIMQDFNDSMEPLTQEQKTQALNDIFNKVDLKSVNALLGTSSERFNQLASGIENSAGAAEKMKETQLDNLAGDVTKLQSAAYNLSVQFSDILTPALRDATQFMTNALMPALSFIVEHFGAIATAITAYVAILVIHNKQVKAATVQTVQQGKMINVLGKEIALTGTAFKVATTASKAFSVALKALKAVAPMLALTLAVEAVMALSDAFNEAQEKSRKFEQATTGLTSAFKNVDESAVKTKNKLNSLDTKKAQNSFKELQSEIDNLIDKQAELAGEIAETWGEINANEALLTGYMNTIDELANKYDENGEKVALTAEEQEKLRVAVAGVNEITGDNIEVIDAQNGVLSKSTEEINNNIDAWLRNAKAQAAQEEIVALAKEQLENEKALKKAREELATATAELNKVDATYADTNASKGQIMQGYAGQVKVAQEEVKRLEDATKSNTEAQRELAGIINGTDSSLQTFISTSSSLKSIVEESGTTVDDLSKRLEELGFSTTDLVDLSDEDFARLVGVYDKSAEEIIAVCEQLGIDVPQKLKDAAQRGASSIGSAAPQFKSEAKKDIDEAKDSLQMYDDDAQTWGKHLAENFSKGLGGDAALGLVRGAANNVSRTIKNILGHTIPKEGVLREGGQGEKKWGLHLVQNIAAGMLGAKSEIRDAADEIAQTIDDSLSDVSPWDSVIDTGEGIARGIMVGYDRVDPIGQMVASMGAVMAMTASNNYTTNNNSNVVNINQPVKSPDEWARYMNRIEHHGLAGKYV